MRDVSRRNGLIRSTVSFLLAIIVALSLSGCGGWSNGVLALRAGDQKSKEGYSLYAHEWYEKAMKEALKASQEGDIDAPLVVGKLYFGGKGVTQDYAEAAKWFQKAADRGNAEAVKLLADAKVKAQEADTRKAQEQQEAEAQKVRAQQEGKIREQQEAEEKKAQAKRAEMAKNIIKQKITVGRLQWAKRGAPGTIGELSVKQQPWVKLQGLKVSLDGLVVSDAILITLNEQGVANYSCFAASLYEEGELSYLTLDKKFLGTFMSALRGWGEIKWARIECFSELPEHRGPASQFQYTFIVMPDFSRAKDLATAFGNPFLAQDDFRFELGLIGRENEDNYLVECQRAWSKLVKPYVPPLTIASMIHTTHADLSVKEIEKRVDEKFVGMRKGLKIEDGGGFTVTYGEKGNGGVEVVVSSGKIIERIDFEQPIAVAEAQWNLIESEASAAVRAKEKSKF